MSPLKNQTIPRLEFLPALLLARLISSVTEALESDLSLSDPCCFSVLPWPSTGYIYKPFVQNRVAEIRKLLPPGYWVHCPGRDNPADLPSRGCTPKELAASPLWMTGPEWLADYALSGTVDLEMPEECRAEMKLHKTEVAHGLFVESPPPGIGQLMKCKDYSCFHRLLSVTSVVVRFCWARFVEVMSPLPLTISPEPKLSG